MSRIIIANGRTGNASQTDFATFISLIKGTAITSLTDAGKFVEFGLSENLLIRIETGEDGTPQIVILSTPNEDEVQPVRLQLINEEEEPSVALVAHRLHNLRQAYAIMLLLDTDRHDALAEILLKDPRVDVERTLLKEDERLLVQAAGPGSLWLTVLTKIAGAPQKALNGLSLIYGKGRGMLFERVQAATDIKKEEAIGKIIENEAKAIENEARIIANDRARDQEVIALSKALDAVKNPEGRLAIQQRLHLAMNSANPQLAGPAIAGLLPAPDSASP